MYLNSKSFGQRRKSDMLVGDSFDGIATASVVMYISLVQGCDE